MEPIEGLDVSCFTIPTDSPESDGTMEWDSTTIVVVESHGAGERGVGYTYGHSACGALIADRLAGVVRGLDVMDVPRAWDAMVGSVRNIGRPGIAAMAISAVDCALWDLKARALGIALADLFGSVRDEIEVYGSGGFTSYDEARLRAQLGRWAAEGFARVKMKVGRSPGDDSARVRAARDAIGARVELFVDANGAYERAQALAMAEAFAAHGVAWFEEPVSSDDLAGLRLLRDRAPAGMRIAAGEYGFDPWYYPPMLDAVHVVQADVTRCLGYTGFLSVAALCEARHVPMSAHCAPQSSAHVCCAARPVQHVEYFHDHARIEGLLFDGALTPRDGRLRPDRSRPGNGLTLKRADAQRFEAA